MPPLINVHPLKLQILNKRCLFEEIRYIFTLTETATTKESGFQTTATFVPTSLSELGDRLSVTINTLGYIKKTIFNREIY